MPTRRLNPLASYLRAETVSALLLVAGAVAAIVWVNSGVGASYQTFVSTELAIAIGQWDIALDLKHWVNDGLMTIFFFGCWPRNKT